MKFSGPHQLAKFLDSHSGRLDLQGASRAEIEFLIYQCMRLENLHKTIVVVKDDRELNAWLEVFDPLVSEIEAVIKPEICALTSFSGWGADRFINPIMTRRQRMRALSELISGTGPSLTVATVTGLGQLTLPLRDLTRSFIELKVGSEIDVDELEELLHAIGFVEVRQVDEEATYAFRGGVIDLFPSNHRFPLRIEMMADEIIAIRHFSVASQKTLDSLEQAIVAPSQEVMVNTHNRRTITQRLYDHLIATEVRREEREGWLDAFKHSCAFPGFEMLAPIIRDENESPLSSLAKEHNFIFTEPIDKLLAYYSDFLDERSQQFLQDVEQHRIAMPVEAHFLDVPSLANHISECQRVVNCGAVENCSSPVSFQRDEVALKLKGLSASERNNFSRWSEFLLQTMDEGVNVVIGLRQRDHFDKLKNLFAHKGVDIVFSEADILTTVATPELQIHTCVADVSDAVFDVGLNLLFIPETILLGRGRSQKSRQSQRLKNYIHSFRDLKVGDLVVHIAHGIGRYLGMRTLEVSGFQAEFLILEYKGGDKVYLPVDKLNLLQKYSSAETSGPSGIDSLKSKNWQLRKTRTKKAVRDMAEELLKQHAKRAIHAGIVYSSPGQEYFKFEGSFPFEETEDQNRVISEINFDLSSSKPMDRLVCGDVGFGKTEVALRAAFRVAFDHYQVVVLVPTTVLCYQHYRNFKSRLEPFGLKVGQLNRFVSRSDQASVVAQFAEGKIDVLVGTHRVLSKDIIARRLGLVIIDEEQRFGVTHKERLKKLKASCDILTLSATPIPRTLHLSMLGLRDISIITTPPVDRLYVKTYVAKFDETLVKSAIERELARGGQVFYVHNRVEDIEQIAALIKGLAPTARVRVAHGQMTEKRLEDVIVDFIEQRFDVLVCTTIIESGIDMPNVNTLIVDRSDRFGLAQLYQLRGRVGRSTRQAYAYFLTPSEERLADDARKRLEILASHQELGAGFQIASHDMELRGVGNLLGAEQSGKIAEVGLDLYTEMLEATIRELQGDKEYEEKRDVEIKIPVQVIIPRSYIKDEATRLQLYKAIFSCESESELERLKSDTRDRFGVFDQQLKRLFKMAYLKILLNSCHVQKLVYKPRGGFELSFYKLSEPSIDALIDIVSEHPSLYRLSPTYQLFLSDITDGERAGQSSREDAILATLIARLEPLHHVFLERA